MSSRPWWQGAIIYQIYPRSFLDGSGDGVGDLPGITARLDYVAALGVDAVWISPFFKSPMADFGYDVSDYRVVDPLFGSLADFDALIEKAHRLGLKVMIDMVLSHTSIEHPWFTESRQDRHNPRANWYVWADPRDDGSPPNNWLSIFGGVAWTWEPRRAQYYLHNFLAAQPDLNFHVPAVREAVLGNVRFWLDRGVDGLRLDAINFCFHDAQLRDNPSKPPAERVGRGFRTDNPYAYQRHVHDNTQPENLGFLAELRALLDRYPDVVALGEVSSEDSAATIAQYTAPGRLHMAYSFDLLGEDGSPAHIRASAEHLQRHAPNGWPCWSISNHDVERVVSRWGHPSAPAHLATQLTALVCSLRGAVCVYQGEELGLPEADVPYEALRDPYGITFWPTFKGRDGCRTPMPWSDDEHAGFSQIAPWLPIPEAHRRLSVARQERDPGSTLHAFRRFMRWRRLHPALLWGDIEFLAADDAILALRRDLDREAVIAVFNLTDQAVDRTLPAVAGATECRGHGIPEGAASGDRVSIPAHGAFFGRIDRR